MKEWIMDSQQEEEIREEIEYLEEKRYSYGWTRGDAERYHSLKKKLGEDE